MKVIGVEEKEGPSCRLMSNLRFLLRRLGLNENKPRSSRRSNNDPASIFTEWSVRHDRKTQGLREVGDSLLIVTNEKRYRADAAGSVRSGHGSIELFRQKPFDELG